MIMLRTKYAPRKASSKILEKKWQEHDYMLHKYRLLAMYGDIGPKPSYHSANQQQNLSQNTQEARSLPRRKVKSAKARSTESTTEMPYSESKRIKRPYTSKPSLQKTKSSRLDDDNQKGDHDKSKLKFPFSQQQISSGRKEKVKLPPKQPMMQQWVRPRGKGNLQRRYRSEYSRDSMKNHFEKHQYIKHNILHRPEPFRRRQKKKNGNSSSDSNYSEDFESDSTEIMSVNEDDDEEGSGDEIKGYVPSPTPTPEPVKEVDKLDFDDEQEEIPDTPVVMPVVEYPKVEINFTPPSHVLKIVADAKDEEGSDWSEEEPVYVLKDGKKGTYIMKGEKYYLSETVKANRKRRLRKQMTEKKKSTDLEDFKEIHYINYEAEDEMEEMEDVEEGGEENEEMKKNEDKVSKDDEGDKEEEESTDDSNGEENASNEDDQMSDGPPTEGSDEELKRLMQTEEDFEEEKKRPKKMKKKKKEKIKARKPKRKASPVYISYKTSDEEEENDKKITQEEVNNQNVDDDEMDYKEMSDEKEEEIDEEEQKKIEENKIHEEEMLATLRSETVNEKYFDAKKDQDSDSDLDEFGRLKDRQRPSSTLFDFLPPLKPDPRLDGGDITHCKNRLSRHVVIIREALARNGPGDLETAVDIIVANNCDNRRWLRKIYRDSYLQSLLLDFRKTLPADVASVISYMMIPVCEFDAMCLWDSLKGLHKDVEVLCEILCTRTNKELEAIRDAYSLRYGEELIDHIEDETISAFQRMMMRLASGQRDENEIWTKEDATREAKAISALLKLKGQHCTKKLVEVFCQHPIDMLRSIINEYKKLNDKELDVELINILKGNFQRAIVTIIHYIQNPPNYFVEKLHATHFRNVDDDKALCRLIISRSEPEKMEMIKQLFMLRYHMELYDYIDRVCTGPLKGIVLRIVAGQLSDEERDNFQFPALWPGREDSSPGKRLTLQKAIITILRRAKVTTKFAKILWAQREKQREEDDSASDYEEPDEDEEDQMNEPDSIQDQNNAMNSEEEQEAEERAAQRELKNGLRNISFAEDPAVTESDMNESVFKDISFANASRGILKNFNLETAEDDAEGAEGNIDSLDELGENTNEHKLTQLNGPVLDPTFAGRGTQQNSKKSFGKGKKKQTVRATVTGISMENFNALKDAQAIGKALLQKKRNIEGILQFLATRNNAQRQLIIREFFRRYRRDLVDDLRMLGPIFEDMTLSLLLANEIYDAVSLYAGIHNPDPVKGVDIIISVLCARQNDEVSIIRRAFQGIFGLNLIEELEKMTVGYCQNMLCLIVECQRDESQNIEEQKARKDAQALYEAMLHRPPDCSAILEIFATRSFQHISMVCEEFSKINKADILEAIDLKLVGTFKEAVTAIVCNTRDAPMYFCERIYKCMAYPPADYSQLIRDVVSRSEIDLAIVKILFRRTYGRTIHSMIDRDTEFRSKKILLDVVKKQ